MHWSILYENAEIQTALMPLKGDVVTSTLELERLRTSQAIMSLLLLGSN
jgi:hypothetical protein